MQAVTDLDRQIAEIKDIAPPTAKQMESLVAIHGQMAPFYWIRTHRGADLAICEPVRFESLNWSTSDSKALELVDELGHPFLMEGLRDHWTASITILGARGQCDNFFQENGATRPEAICRAYIAAVTWMRGRG